MTDVICVDDCVVEVAVIKLRTNADEYDSHSQNDSSDR